MSTSLAKTSSSTTAVRGDLDGYTKDIDNDLKRTFQKLRRVPDITTGTAVPTTTPSRIGNMYVDTTNKKIYFATGHTSSADWTVVN